MYKCYLFDFDGTLVDSMPVYVASMLRILDENGIAYGDDIVKIITPLGLNGTADYFLHHMGLQIPKEALVDLMKTYFMDAYFHTIPPKDNVISVLKELKNRGASINVLTAGPHITLDACLKRLDMWDLFDHIWSCDDFSTTKTDPDIYRRAAKEMGYPVEEVLFLDDNLNADQAAKAAGMTVCGVYDDSSRDYETQIRAATYYYIYNLQELLAL